MLALKPNSTNFPITDFIDFKDKMLNMANKFSIFCFLDHNGYKHEPPAFECMLALGAKRSILLQAGNAFAQLKSFYDQNPGWLFGHLGYDLKNEVEAVHTKKTACIDFGIGFFFEPEIIIRLTSSAVEIIADTNAAEIFNSILSEQIKQEPLIPKKINLLPAFSNNAYLEIIQQIRQHIRRGDCYEINFCQQFHAKDAQINPLNTFKKLNRLSPNPFAAYYRINDKYCLCASPERYLKKEGHKLISQPIKGTAKRDLQNPAQDAANKQALLNSAKERSENVMIVDLVRNDLSRVCTQGSVQVNELFGIYAFPQVFQMISTITGTLSENTHWTDCIKQTFPMGSMTGAPKKRVMELIDEFETEGRGLFSGSIGYVTPGGDFDFNVIIRSIFYDETTQKLSYAAGSGITFYSNAEDEYEECLLKAVAMKEVLG
ncbi:MAG: anthranilate synthase component I family protein [Ferruginibacter sp.]